MPQSGEYGHLQNVLSTISGIQDDDQTLNEIL